MDKKLSSGKTLPQQGEVGGAELSENWRYAVYTSLLLLVVSLLFYVWKSSRRSVPRVLLIGPVASGKTSLFNILTDASNLKTFTSMQENIAESVFNGKRIRLVDIPGHNRVRPSISDKYRNESDSILYVVNSKLFDDDEAKDDAEILYGYLSDEEFAKKPLLVICNEADEEKTQLDKIASTLERQINTICKTYSHSNQGKSLCRAGEDFKFNSLQNRVNFITIPTYDTNNAQDIKEKLFHWIK